MEKHAFSYIYAHSFVWNDFFNGHSLLCSIQQRAGKTYITRSLWQMPSFLKWIWELRSIRYILRLPSVPRSVTSLRISIFTTKLINTRTQFWWNCAILKNTIKLYWNFCFSTLVCITILEGSKNRLQFLSEDFSFFLYSSSLAQQNHRYYSAALHKTFAQFSKDT